MLNLDALMQSIQEFFCWAFGIEQQKQEYLYIPIEREEERRRPGR
ncbi:hypothetical protein TDB9533_01458 [Thalassocella blandensis]|nr:hypothetical protein TDB9533_01458 [Thalassocella blandensis]